MPQSEPIKFTFDRPGNYCIRIQGSLDEVWSETLGGMRIIKSSGKDQVPITELYGLLRDQSALWGVLNTLYDMHMTLLSVERVEND